MGEADQEAEDARRIAAHTGWFLKQRIKWTTSDQLFRLSDIGTLTLLYSQPVGGLQILNPDGKWRFVRPLD
jgi:hypothetical protein